jgi:raffinose/stachyose/melibiose transport system permease protein
MQRVRFRETRVVSGQYQTDWSKVLAVLTLSAIPVISLYLIASKQFIRGLTAGAVKG